jgi:hypothetical protein
MTFKAATAKPAIRIVEVPVKVTIATIFQRTRPQPRRKMFRIRDQPLEWIIGKGDSVDAMGSPAEGSPQFSVALESGGSLQQPSSTPIAQPLPTD